MENTDVNIQIKVVNNNPELMEEYGGGIARRGHRLPQELHHARHVLSYFVLALHFLLQGKRGRLDSRKAERIRIHLACLREFLPEGNPSLRGAVDLALRLLGADLPKDDRSWARFLRRHWELLAYFARCYGHEADCFPAESRKKLGDIATGRELFRVWWWHMRWKRLIHRIGLNA